VDLRTKAKIALVVVVLALASLCWFGLGQYRARMACKQRGAALVVRTEDIKRDAHNELAIGVKKDDVIRFFTDHNISVHFDPKFNSAEGTIYTAGCSPFGCGTDRALIGVWVKVDQAGTVQSEPVVVSIYTDCL
jgi:hypothetical protein